MDPLKIVKCCHLHQIIDPNWTCKLGYTWIHWYICRLLSHLQLQTVIPVSFKNGLLFPSFQKVRRVGQRERWWILRLVPNHLAMGQQLGGLCSGISLPAVVQKNLIKNQLDFLQSLLVWGNSATLIGFQCCDYIDISSLQLKKKCHVEYLDYKLVPLWNMCLEKNTLGWFGEGWLPIFFRIPLVIHEYPKARDLCQWDLCQSSAPTWKVNSDLKKTELYHCITTRNLQCQSSWQSLPIPTNSMCIYIQYI